MKDYVVYRIENERTQRIGDVADRRNSERGDNQAGLLKLARKNFGKTDDDPHIYIVSATNPPPASLDDDDTGIA